MFELGTLAWWITSIYNSYEKLMYISLVPSGFCSILKTHTFLLLNGEMVINNRPPPESPTFKMYVLNQSILEQQFDHLPMS